MWPFDIDLDALNGIWELINSIPWKIAPYMLAVVMTVFYPVIAILDIAYSFVQNQYEVLAAFINATLAIPNMIFYTFDAFITMNFPPIIVWVLVTLITIRILQLIYKHVKGISIAGFKIG